MTSTRGTVMTNDEAGMSVLGPWWAVLALLVLAGLALFAAVLEAALDARATGASGATMRPVGEVARLLRQRRRTTPSADRLLWRGGGALLLLAAALMVTVIPVGDRVLADLDVGVLWFNAMDVLVWAGVWLVGWGANSVHSLVGGYRFLAQALGYELPLMFALIAPAIAAGSLNLGVIQAEQEGLWFALWMPVAFLVYLLGVAAFSVWGPFGQALGADVAGGARAELSGPDRLLLEVGRYALLAAGAAFAVPMFLGGGAGPLMPAWAWVLVKTIALLVALVWGRRRIPALRPDLFMETGWMLVLPAVLVQDLVVAVIATRGW